MSKIFSTQEAANYCGIAVETLRGLRRDGKFAPALRYGRLLGFSQTDLDFWIAENWQPEHNLRAVS